MQIISTIGLITINETMIVQLVSFLIFLYIINRIMFRPLRAIMRTRDNHIEEFNIGIANAGNELKVLLDQLKDRESEAKKEAFALKEEREKSGSLQAEEIFDATREKIQTLSETAKREVDAQIADARKSIQKESEALAANIMEKMLDRRLDP
jgi:F-type H+-transporting ATPase subunit b